MERRSIEVSNGFAARWLQWGTRRQLSPEKTVVSRPDRQEGFAIFLSVGSIT
jgi:hypothetical protein